jgi:hypothetical protein
MALFKNKILNSMYACGYFFVKTSFFQKPFQVAGIGFFKLLLGPTICPKNLNEMFVHQLITKKSTEFITSVER